MHADDNSSTDWRASAQAVAYKRWKRRWDHQRHKRITEGTSMGGGGGGILSGTHRRGGWEVAEIREKARDNRKTEIKHRPSCITARVDGPPALPHPRPAFGALGARALIQQRALRKTHRALVQTATGRGLRAETRQLLVQERAGVVRVKQAPQRRLVRHAPHEHEFSRRHGRERCKLRRRGSPAGGRAEEVLRVLGCWLIVVL